jgi:hypothetical protein
MAYQLNLEISASASVHIAPDETIPAFIHIPELAGGARRTCVSLLGKVIIAKHTPVRIYSLQIDLIAGRPGPVKVGNNIPNAKPRKTLGGKVEVECIAATHPHPRLFCRGCLVLRSGLPP